VLLAVQCGDGSLCFIVRTHFDEPEALASPGHAITDHLGADDRSVLSEDVLQLRAIDIVAQISNVQTLTHTISSNEELDPRVHFPGLTRKGPPLRPAG
jgi:hypothetical protein